MQGQTQRKIHQCRATTLLRNYSLHKSHRRATPTHDAKDTHCSATCLNPGVFTSIFATRMVRAAEELHANENMAAQSVGNKKIAETLGVPLRTMKRSQSWASTWRGSLFAFCFSCSSSQSFSSVCAWRWMLWRGMCNDILQRHSSAPRLQSRRAALLPVCADICKHLTSSAAVAPSTSTWQRSTGSFPQAGAAWSG